MLDHRKIRNLIIGAIALVVAAVVVIVIAVEHTETRREKATAAAASSASVWWNGTPFATPTPAPSPSLEELQRVADVTLKVVSWKDGDGTGFGDSDPMVSTNAQKLYTAPWPELLAGKTGAQVYMLGSSADPAGDHSANLHGMRTPGGTYQTIMLVASNWRVTWWGQSASPAQAATQKSVSSNGTFDWQVTYDWATKTIVQIDPPTVAGLRLVPGL